MPRILVDADACPVKAEIYRVAERYGVQVLLVANSIMRVPEKDGIERIVVSGGLDAADDWIAETVAPDDIVVSADIPLAARCLEKGAQVLAPNGKPFSDDTIGAALATRELHAELRQTGAIRGGPAPLDKKDRSRFLQNLDAAIQRVRRRGPG